MDVHAYFAQCDPEIVNSVCCVDVAGRSTLLQVAQQAKVFGHGPLLLCLCMTVHRARFM